MRLGNRARTMTQTKRKKKKKDLQDIKEELFGKDLKEKSMQQ